jgi:hypothetical protein
MRNRSLLVAGVLLAGCSMEVPPFLGREGSGAGTYSLDEEPLPEPVPVPLRRAEAERGLHGVIVRAEGIAPTQGYWGAELRPAAGPDAAGVLGFQLVAVPPPAPEAVGPERTRVLTAGVFLPNLALEDLSAVRVAGAAGVRTLPLP